MGKWSETIFTALMGLILLGILFFSLNLHSCILQLYFLSPDSHEYLDAAKMLYSAGTPHPTRPLGFASILGFPYLLFPLIQTPNIVAIMLIVNVIAWLGAIMVLHKSVSHFYSRKCSLLITSLFMISIGSMSMVFNLLTETVTALLLMLGTRSLLNYDRTGDLRQLVQAVAILNCAPLIRPGFFYFGIFTGLVITVDLIDRKKIRYLFHPIFITSVMLLVIQMVSMHNNYGRFTPSFIGPITWEYCLGAQPEACSNNSIAQTERNERKEYFAKLNWKEKSDAASADVRNQLFNHTSCVFKNYISNLVQNSTSASPTPEEVGLTMNGGPSRAIVTSFSLISRLQNILFILLALAGAVFQIALFRKTHAPGSILIGLLIWYVILTSGILSLQGDQFHVLLYPVICLYFFWMLKQWRERKKNSVQLDRSV